MKIREENVLRKFTISNGALIYQESNLDDKEKIIDFFSMVKGNDYSIYYFNATDEEKVGEFLIKKDSIFYVTFNNLISENNNFMIEDDYTERYVEFTRNDEGIKINIHLQANEYDGTIELKNIMHDLRCKSDAYGKNTKSKLNKFFDEMLMLSINYTEMLMKPENNNQTKRKVLRKSNEY